MEQDPTIGQSLGESLSWSFSMLGQVAFTWIPGAVVALLGTGDPNVIGQPPQVLPITHPVTTSDIGTYLQTAAAPDAYQALYHGWGTYVALATFASLCLSALIIYCSIRIRQIRHQEHLQFLATAHPIAAQSVSKTHLRWQRILEQGHSESEESWRLAILEADIMLNELLDARGYKGETMGDKMRQVERGDFNTIDLAWEAHRVRNKVAHEGAAHLLNVREVRRILGLYERVFREFKVIE